MLKRAVHGLLLLAAFAQPMAGLAQTTATPAATVFPATDDELHEKYPEYVGFEVYDGTLFLNVDSLDASLCLRVLRDVLRTHSAFLEALQAVPGRVRFLRSVPDQEVLDAAEAAVRNVRGVTGVSHGSRIGRLVIELQYPNQRPGAGPSGRWGVLECRADSHAPAAPFPAGAALAGSYQPALQVSPLVRQGEKLPITLHLRNEGPRLLTFEQGACDLHVEIRRVGTNAVVLPGQGHRLCLDLGYRAALLPGQRTALASWTWTAQGTNSRPLAPGAYEVRAVFGPVGLKDSSQRPTQFSRRRCSSGS
ncbi:hypothetical protein [Deinococcus hohokamensis]|uniref:Intracellular proteinase inhibitor BsuPI domain-containing protein n=1 Tax=Deinococcus hohokamensis TaxID=309883 RepID=A0ABV9ID91_9DEIO